jgi:uncharacterized protein (DUF1330 family)
MTVLIFGILFLDPLDAAQVCFSNSQTERSSKFRKAKAFRKYGGRFLTRGRPHEAPEGKPRSHCPR